MIVFLQCVAEAAAEHGVKYLAKMSGVEVAYDVAKGAIDKYRRRLKDEQQRADIEKLARASFDEEKVFVDEAALKVADQLTPDELVTLKLYLSQVPAQVRQTLKRADDPSGRSVQLGYVLRTADDALRLLPLRPPQFRPGDTVPGLSSWRLDRPLGTGGYGEVWLATHEWLSPRAIKFCTDAAVRQRLTRHEKDVVVRVIKQGIPPGIVPLLEVNLDGGCPWLMYEYVAGGDLSDWLRENAGLPDAERVPKCLSIIREVATIVGHLHALTPPVVHRDLKPSNILWDQTSGRLRITDFGIGGVSAAAANDADRAGATSYGGRLLSQLWGSHTITYSSRQQRAGAGPDPRDDVHALGVIAYQLLVGQLDAEVRGDCMRQLRRRGVPEVLAEVIACAAGDDLRDRPADATALLFAMDETRQGRRTSAVDPNKPRVVGQPLPQTVDADLREREPSPNAVQASSLAGKQAKPQLQSLSSQPVTLVAATVSEPSTEPLIWWDRWVFPVFMVSCIVGTIGLTASSWRPPVSSYGWVNVATELFGLPILMFLLVVLITVTQGMARDGHRYAAVGCWVFVSAVLPGPVVALATDWRPGLSAVGWIDLIVLVLGLPLAVGVCAVVVAAWRENSA